MDELRTALHDGMAQGARLEHAIPVIEHDSIDSRPLFIDNDELMAKVRLFWSLT